MGLEQLGSTIAHRQYSLGVLGAAHRPPFLARGACAYSSHVTLSRLRDRCYKTALQARGIPLHTDAHL